MTYIEQDTFADHDTDLNSVMHPSSAFDHPRDVVNDPDLRLAEKRAILSSWALDACAVESAPGLRKPPGARSAVSFDDIVDALQSLDGPTPPRKGGARTRPLVWPFGAGTARTRGGQDAR